MGNESKTAKVFPAEKETRLSDDPKLLEQTRNCRACLRKLTNSQRRLQVTFINNPGNK